MEEKKLRKTNLTIMVIDDADLTRRSTVEILEKEGFNVIAQASSAEEAIQLTAQAPANLYIIDVVMPEVSGIELAKNISENIKDCFIIMMSSLNMESIIIESISNGAIDFLHKPFSAESLIKSVEKIEEELSKDS
jgi:DNA-binding NarL/FixJ family response regulator